MNTSSRSTLAVLCAAAAILASCSSSGPTHKASPTTVAPAVASSSTSGAPSSGGVATVNGSVAKVLAQQTAAVNMSIAVGGGPASTITGPFNLAQGQGQLSLNIQGTAAGAAIPNPTDLTYAGGNIYVKASGVMLSFDGNKPYAQLTPSAIDNILCLLMPGTNPSTVAQLAGGNPGQLLSILSTPAMTVAPAGTSTVNGTPLTMYQVTIDAAKAAQSATGAAKTLFDAIASSGSTAPLTVGIDAHGNLRTLAVTFEASSQHVSLSLSLDQFGTSVSSSAPPADQVGQLTIPGGCANSGSSTG